MISDDISSTKSGDTCSYDESDSTHDVKSSERDASPRVTTDESCASHARLHEARVTHGAAAPYKTDDRQRDPRRRSNIPADDHEAGQFLKSMSKTQRDAWQDKRGHNKTRDGQPATETVSKVVWNTVCAEKASSRTGEGVWRTADKTRGGSDDSRSDEDQLGEDNDSNYGGARQNLCSRTNHDDECSDNEDMIRKFENAKFSESGGCQQERGQDYHSGSLNTSDLSESERETGERRLGEPEKTVKKWTDNRRGDSKCESVTAANIRKPKNELGRADTNTPNTIINKRYTKLMSKMAGDGFSGLGDMEICTRHSRCEMGDYVTKQTSGDDEITGSDQGLYCEIGGWKSGGAESGACDENTQENRFNVFPMATVLHHSVESSEADFEENSMMDPKLPSRKMTTDEQDCERDKRRQKSKLVSSSRHQVQDQQGFTSASGHCGQGSCRSETIDKSAKSNGRVADNLSKAYKEVADVAIENILGAARKPEALNSEFAKGSGVSTLGAQTNTARESSETGALPQKTETLNNVTDLAQECRGKTVDSSTEASLTPTEASLFDRVITEDGLQQAHAMEYHSRMGPNVYENLSELEEIGNSEIVSCLPCGRQANNEQSPADINGEHCPREIISNLNKSGEVNLAKMKVPNRDPADMATEDDTNVTYDDGRGPLAKFDNKTPLSSQTTESCEPVKTVPHQAVDKSGLRVRFNIQEKYDVIPLPTTCDGDGCSVGGILSYKADRSSSTKNKTQTNLPSVFQTNETLGQSFHTADNEEGDVACLRAKTLNGAMDAGKTLSDTGSMMALRKEINKQLVTRALKNTHGNRTILEMKKQERANYQKFEALKQSRLDEEKRQQLALVESNRQGPEYCITGNKLNVEKKSKMYKPSMPRLSNPNHMPALTGAKVGGGKAPVTRNAKLKLPSITQGTCASEKRGSKNKGVGRVDIESSNKSFQGSSEQSSFAENNEREVNTNYNKAASHDSNVSSPPRDRGDVKQKVEVVTFESQRQIPGTAKSKGILRDNNSNKPEPKKNTRFVLPKINQQQNQKTPATVTTVDQTPEDTWNKKELTKLSGVGKTVSTGVNKNKMDNPQAVSRQSKGDNSSNKTAKSCLPPIFEKKSMKDMKASVEHSYRNILDNSPLSSPTAPCKLPKVGQQANTIGRGKVQGSEKASKQSPLQGNGRNKQPREQPKVKGSDNNVTKTSANGAKKKCKSRENETCNETLREGIGKAASAGGDLVQSKFDQVQAEIDQKVGHVLSSKKNRDKQQPGTKPLSKTQQMLIKAKTDFLDQLEEMDTSFLNDIVSDASTAMYARDKKKPLIRNSEPRSLNELKKRRTQVESDQSSSASTSKSESEDDDSEDDKEDDDCVVDEVDTAGGKHANSGLDTSYSSLKSKALSKARSRVRTADEKINLPSADETRDYPMLNKSSNAVVEEMMMEEVMHPTYPFVERSYNGRISRQTGAQILHLFETEKGFGPDHTKPWGDWPPALNIDSNCFSYEQDVFLLDQTSFFHGNQNIYVLNENFAVSTEQLLHTGSHNLGQINLNCCACRQISDRMKFDQNLCGDTKVQYTWDVRLKTESSVNDLGDDPVLSTPPHYATEKNSMRPAVHADKYTTTNVNCVEEDSGLTMWCPDSFCYTKLRDGGSNKERTEHHSTYSYGNVISDQPSPRLCETGGLPECFETPTNYDFCPVQDGAYPRPLSCLRSDSGFWEADHEQNLNFNNSKGGSEVDDDHAHSPCPSANDFSTRCDLERIHCWSTSMDTLLPCKDDTTDGAGKDLRPTHKQVRRSRIPVRIPDAQPRHWSGRVSSFQYNNVPQNLEVVVKNKHGVQIGQAVAPILFKDVDNRAASTSAQQASARRGTCANYFTVEIRGTTAQAVESGRESAEDDAKPVSLAERIKKYQKNQPRNIHCGRGTKQNQWAEQPYKAPPSGETHHCGRGTKQNQWAEQPYKAPPSGETHAQNQMRITSGQSSGKKTLAKRPSMELVGHQDQHTNRNDSIVADQTKYNSSSTDIKMAEGADVPMLKEEPNLTPCIKSAKIHKNTSQPMIPNRNVVSKLQKYPKKLSAGSAPLHQAQSELTPQQQRESPPIPKDTCLIAQCELFTPASSRQSLNANCATNTADKQKLSPVGSTAAVTDEPKCAENSTREIHPDNHVTLPDVCRTEDGEHVTDTTSQHQPTRHQSANSSTLDPVNGLTNQFILEHPSVLAVDESLNLFLEYEQATLTAGDHTPELEQERFVNDSGRVTESKTSHRLETPRDMAKKDSERSNDRDKHDQALAKSDGLQAEDHVSSRQSAAAVSLAKPPEDHYQLNETSSSRSSSGSTPSRRKCSSHVSSTSPDKHFLQLIYKKVDNLQNVSLAREIESWQNENEQKHEEYEQDEWEHEQKHGGNSVKYDESEKEDELREQDVRDDDQEERDIEDEHSFDDGHHLEDGHDLDEDNELNDLHLAVQQTGESQETIYSPVEQINSSRTSRVSDVTDYRRNEDADSHDFEPKMAESNHSFRNVRYEESPHGASNHDSEIDLHGGTRDLGVSTPSRQISPPCSGGEERNEVKEGYSTNVSRTPRPLSTPPATARSNTLGTPGNKMEVGESIKIHTPNSRQSLTVKTSSPDEMIFVNDKNVQTTIRNESGGSSEIKRFKSEPIMKKSGIDLKPTAAAMSPTLSKKSRKSRGVIFEKINFTSAESESSEVKLKELSNNNNYKIPFLKKSYSLGETRLPGGREKLSLSSDGEQGMSECQNACELLYSKGDVNPSVKMSDTEKVAGTNLSSNRKTLQHSQSDTKRSLSEDKKSQIPIKSSKKSSGQQSPIAAHQSPIAAHQERCVVPYSKKLVDDLSVRDCVLEYSMRSSSQGSEVPPAQPRKGRLTMIFPTVHPPPEGEHLDSVQTSHNSTVDQANSNDEEFYSSEDNEHNTTFSVDEHSRPTNSLDPSNAATSQEWTFTTNVDQSQAACFMEQANAANSVEQHRQQDTVTPTTPINTFRKTTPMKALKKKYTQVVNSHQNPITQATQFQQNALPPLSTRQAGFPHRPKLKRYY